MFMDVHSGQTQQSRMIHSFLSNSHGYASTDSGLSDELVAVGCGPGTSNLTIPFGLSDDPELLAADCGPGTWDLTIPLGLVLSFAFGLLLGTAMGLAPLERLRFRDGCGLRWMR